MLTIRIAYYEDGNTPRSAPARGYCHGSEADPLEVGYLRKRRGGAHGYETSREAAQIDGDSALFAMLSLGAR